MSLSLSQKKPSKKAGLWVQVSPELFTRCCRWSWQQVFVIPGALSSGHLGVSEKKGDLESVCERERGPYNIAP